MTHPAFSVIVPCYNEAAAILDTIMVLKDSLKNFESYELILVDDGSSDGTRELIHQAASSDSRIKSLYHTSNRGYGAALKTGIRQSLSELIVITDADGTYPNDRIGDLLDAANHADMVVGARTGENVIYPLIRKIPKVFLRAYASWLSGQEIPDINSGLRVFRRPIAERFLSILPDGFSFTTTITLAMLTNFYDVRYIPISYSPRIGKSKIKPIRDTIRFIQLIIRTGTYFAPLRVFGPLVVLLFCAFLASLSYDIFILGNIADKTIIFLMFSLNTGMFALLADAIHMKGS